MPMDGTAFRRASTGAIVRLLPNDDAVPPTRNERVRFLLLVLTPWIVLYEVTVNVQESGIAFKLALDDQLPLHPWTILIYWSSYVTVPLAPWFARTRRELRRLMTSAWVATALVFPFYWLVPSRAPRPELADTTWATHLLLWERGAYPPVAAFPSFHVLWAIIVAPLFHPRWWGAAYVALVALSCVTTGQHYVADVLAALALAPVLLAPGRCWAVVVTGGRACCRLLHAIACRSVSQH
jgi:hypothetical protein